jgi:hypothetical protein
MTSHSVRIPAFASRNSETAIKDRGQPVRRRRRRRRRRRWEENDSGRISED